jgi:hypothetical protein
MKKPGRAALPRFKNPSNKIWNFWNRKNQFWIKFNDVSSLCKLLEGPGRNKVIISIYSIRVFFKKGNLL